MTCADYTGKHLDITDENLKRRDCGAMLPALSRQLQSFTAGMPAQHRHRH
jgi:hypothetical protein